MSLPVISWNKLMNKLGLSRQRRPMTTAQLKHEARCRLGFEQLEPRHMLSGFSIGDAVSVGESGSLAFTVSLSQASCRPVTVQYQTSDGTAKAGEDYTATSGELTFARGETTKQILVPLLNDTVAETSEAFTLELLKRKCGRTITLDSATGTINDDDSSRGSEQPALSINDVTVSESAGTAQFTVSLSSPASQSVSVSYATIAHTAVAGADFTAVSNGSLTFASGETQKTVSITINNDSVDEPTEHFHVALVSATGATIADGEGDGNIEDDDAPPTIGFDPTNLIVSEGAGTAQLTVKLTGNETAQTVTAGSTTSDHTATADVDFTTTTTTLTFLPGERTKTVEVPIIEDDLADDAEHFHGVLSNIVNATAGETSVEVVISDNDGPGGSGGDEEDGPLTVGFDPVNMIVSEGAGFARLTIKLTGVPTTQTVTASLATTAHTAVAGLDYTATTTNLSFAPGERVKTVDVPILEDTAPDDAEHFHAVLFNISGAAAGQTSVEVVISDNDAASLASFAALSAQQAANIEDVSSVGLSSAAVSVGSQDFAAQAQESTEEDDDPPSTPEQSSTHSADYSGTASKAASGDKETDGDKTADGEDEDDWHGRRDRLDKEHIGHEELGQIAGWLKGFFRHWRSEREHSGDRC